MAKLITGLFRTRSSSMLAVEDLQRHGLPVEDISVQMTDTNTGREFFTNMSTKAPEGGVTGTIIGAIAGGLLASLCALGYIPDPGIGLATHGVIVGTLCGIGVGSLTGLLIGLMAGSAVPEYESNLCALDKPNGGILVGVYCHERREGEVRRLLEAAGGTTLRSRVVATEPIRIHTTTPEYAAMAAGGASDSTTSLHRPAPILPPVEREVSSD